MKLRYSPTSPYVRKVMVSLLELGLRDRVELQATNVWDPETDIGLSNPLGKVPALILDNGQVLFDSPVICEYLDAQIPQVVLFPAVGEARWKALRFQALGDGLMDAGVLRLLEGRRDPALQSEGWKDRQLAAINRGLDALEAGVNDLSGGPLTIGQISVACALGWIEFRLGDHNLLSTRPLLKSWYEGFKARASMQATEPKE
ncbi:glutathione S-transferase N-terminal domain-containing protein [Terasakiella pusilla]|uniref:glutathione S-transferase N-terminal domain-containing protein n=1 Tax=Terasakiella pusilla TaxID=64973 RepID=UPI00048B6BCF|nr:glutathione S-transferase N-terminal domain-containing protein [Terasakiella pusilla]